MMFATNGSSYCRRGGCFVRLSVCLCVRVSVRKNKEFGGAEVKKMEKLENQQIDAKWVANDGKRCLLAFLDVLGFL